MNLIGSLARTVSTVYITKVIKKLTSFPNEKKKLTSVPNERRTAREKYLYLQEIELYCTCLMPETYGGMVQCNDCEKWYHLKS